jgi:hypothetical protein
MTNGATTVEVVEEGPLSAVSWGAIVAGGFVAAALTLFLLALGAGIGLSVVSPWGNASVSSTHAALGAGIYLVLSAIIASAIGGYIAGRLRRRWRGADADEVYFRDTAHGFLTWAFATVLSAAFLTSAGTAMIGQPAIGITTGSGHGFDAAPFVDRLLRPQLNASAASTLNAPAGQTGTTTGGTTAAPAPAPAPELTQTRPVVLGGPALVEVRATLSRLLLSSLANTNPREADGLTVDDRTYMGQIVTAYTGLNATQADQRVSEVTQRMRTAADTTRRAARNLALWLAGSLLFGAFAASLAALEGGGLRDGRLRYGPRFTIERVPSP